MKRAKMIIAIVALVWAAFGLFGCSTYTCPTYAGTYNHRAR